MRLPVYANFPSTDTAKASFEEEKKLSKCLEKYTTLQRNYTRRKVEVRSIFDLKQKFRKEEVDVQFFRTSSIRTVVQRRTELSCKQKKMADAPRSSQSELKRSHKSAEA